MVQPALAPADTRSVRLFDQYDWGAVAAVIALTLLGVLLIGSWPVAFALGAVVGNGFAYLLRRRATLRDLVRDAAIPTKSS